MQSSKITLKSLILTKIRILNIIFLQSLVYKGCKIWKVSAPLIIWGEVIAFRECMHHLLRVLRVSVHQSVRALVQDVGSPGLCAKVLHLISGVLSTQEYEGQGTKRRFHPIPRPGSNLQYILDREDKEYIPFVISET